jgi:hypothetical protein
MDMAIFHFGFEKSRLPEGIGQAVGISLEGVVVVYKIGMRIRAAVNDRLADALTGQAESRCMTRL